jgi:biopolymer transport protein ExbD
VALGKLPEADVEGEEAIFSEINITPLTDIFLVLLIIFMIGSTISADKMREEAKKEKSSGIKVNLPSGSSKEVDPGRKSIVVAIAQGGQVTVDGQALTEEQLDGMFQSAALKDKETQVVLRADQGVRHGRVVLIMERAKRVGLHRLAIATRGSGDSGGSEAPQ